MSSQPAVTKVPGACDVPVAQRTAEIGCYLVAITPLGALPSDPLYWHLYQYQTRAPRQLAAVDDDGERLGASGALSQVTCLLRFYFRS